jgi:hypothetical protein
MADTNKERLLTDLLRDIAATDADAEAAGLESRVMTAWDQSAGAVRLKPDFTYRASTYAKVICGLAAAVAIAVWLPASQDIEPVNPQETGLPAITLGNESPNVRLEAGRGSDAGPAYAKPPAVQRTAPPRRKPDVTNVASVDPMEFVPLMPITGQELGGSFQIVRVQMPRASLGALASPLEHPDGLVEADVLLGEDGMARAIRVSSRESIHPRRSR